MTSDLELNKKLALAIGWREDQMAAIHGHLHILVPPRIFPFSYLDWNIIGPVAERFDCFPFYMAGMWWVGGTLGNPIKADTPQKAIALAVIQGAKV